jgi:predicted RNA methylase
MSSVSRNRKRPANCPEEDELTPVDGIARGPSVELVGHALRTGMIVDDRAFDRFLPYHWRLASSQHWTPLVVVQRVAAWLDELGVETVVDIGSGAGKFCVAAALASHCEFTGIEQRARLVEAARDLAQRFGVEDRVRFVHGALGQCSLPEAEAYYLYNPFGENLFGSDGHLGDDVELSDERYERDVALMEAFLERARVGTYIIKYNGFGGHMPRAYEPIRLDREMPSVLRIWQKTRPSPGTTRPR